MLTKFQIIIIVGLLLIVATVLTLALRSRYPERTPLVPPQRFLAWWMIVVGLIYTHVVGSNPKLGGLPNILGFAGLTALSLRQFFSHLKTPLRTHTKVVCYLAAALQYYWVYTHWYGFFVVFVPVFLFLYLPASGLMKDDSSSPLLQMGSVHWILMTAIFCLSHAAYLVVLPGGPGLLFFVVLITEMADASRMVLAGSKLPRPAVDILSILVAVATAWCVAPAFTPLTPEHTLLAGVVLGLAGTIGHANITSLRGELGILPGGPLERVESLAYTAPIFLHGYRYFDYPL